MDENLAQGAENVAPHHHDGEQWSPITQTYQQRPRGVETHTEPTTSTNHSPKEQPINWRSSRIRGDRS